MTPTRSVDVKMTLKKTVRANRLWVQGVGSADGQMQVHLVLETDEQMTVARLKSAQVLDELIGALVKARDEVFPNSGRANVYCTEED